VKYPVTSTTRSVPRSEKYAVPRVDSRVIAALAIVSPGRVAFTDDTSGNGVPAG
jgi:hypothetical protein